MRYCDEREELYSQFLMYKNYRTKKKQNNEQ